MKSVTIYFKDSDREITINGLINILIGTSDSRKPFVPVSDHYMFFDDDKNYLFNGVQKEVFIRGSAILCASVTKT